MTSKVKVPHPEFGHVIFTNPTPRQKDVLEVFKNYMEGLLTVKEKVFQALDAEKEK